MPKKIPSTCLSVRMEWIGQFSAIQIIGALYARLCGNCRSPYFGSSAAIPEALGRANSHTVSTIFLHLL